MLLPTIAGAGLFIGFVLRIAGRADVSQLIWMLSTIPILVFLISEIVISLKSGEIGLDIVASLSMSVALFFGENLAALVVALMYSGGRFLENYADRRAGQEMTALLSKVPHSAMRFQNGHLQEVPIETIAPGDRLIVRSGEIVPVDGTAEETSLLDYSSLTGESLPVQTKKGEQILSGTNNVGHAFTFVATRSSVESTLAGIVRLVESARASKSPMSRLADRYSIVFLLLTIVLSVGAWRWTGDPIRALSVLVIATPCPLILAVPVALVAGLSRAAKHGVLIKGGTALETLAKIRCIVFDKTGTLTSGMAKVTAVHTVPGLSVDEALQIAASLDQASTHVIAQALVNEARIRGLSLLPPTLAEEIPGEGICGKVGERRVIVGGPKFVKRRLRTKSMPLLSVKATPGIAMVALAIDGKHSAVFVLSDTLRQGVSNLLQSLRSLGIERLVLASGDSQAVADEVAAGLLIDVVKGDLDPAGKVAIIHQERLRGPVMMIGDGVNDAPALAAADVGVAMGARGAAASAEAADVVILKDQLDPILLALRDARRARAIALQSVTAGLGLSIAGMMVAALGYLTPVEGAIIQEVIDVLVILNALRVLR